MFTPQTRSFWRLKRSCENGIHISALQPSRVDRRPRFPDGIEPGVEALLVVARVKAIEADTGGGHAKCDGCPSVEECVEPDPDVLGLSRRCRGVRAAPESGAFRVDILAPT